MPAPRSSPVATPPTTTDPFQGRAARNIRKPGRWRRGRAASDRESRSGSGTARRCPRSRLSPRRSPRRGFPGPTGPPPNLSMIVLSSRRSDSSNPCASTSSSSSAAWQTSVVIRPSAFTCAKSRTRRSKPVRDARRASRPARDLERRLGRDLHAQNARRSPDDLDEIGFLIEVEPVDDAEARPERRREQARARRRADERERLHRKLDATARPDPGRPRCRSGSPPWPDTGTPRSPGSCGALRR